ncbi:hypothetical protein HZ996_00775 [Cryomorphaceae bacterium]|nr:hypothetical protein HZ996_00775 [Cryomorphaceae bacterium]
MQIWAFRILKVVIVAGSIWYLYQRFQDISLQDYEGILLKKESGLGFIRLVFLLLVLSLTSWISEALKWKLLFQIEFEQTVSRSLKVVLISHVAGLISPFKAGEYGFRSYLVPKELGKFALGRQWLNNLNLNFVKALVGGPAAIYFLTKILDLNWNPAPYLLILWVLLLLLFIFLYKSFEGIFHVFIPLSWRLKGAAIPEGARLDSSRMRILSVLNLFRFMSYSIGNILIWCSLGLSCDYWLIFCLFQAIYLLALALPVLSLFDVVVKSSLVLVLSGPFGFDPGKVVLAVFVNWFFMTVIPMIFGLILLIKEPLNSRA